MTNLKAYAALLLAALALPVRAQRISFERTTVGVGSTLWHKPVTATFKFKNKDKEPLVVEQVDAGCGCLEPTWTRTPLQKGEEGVITVTYDARQLGRFDRYIEVRTNAPGKPARIRMNGVVTVGARKTIDDLYPVRIGEVALATNSVEFPDVVRGDSATARLEILNDSRDVFTPRLMHLPPYVTARYIPEMLARGRRGYIDLTLHSDKIPDMGLTQTSVYLSRFSGDKVGHDNEVVLSAVVLPDAATLQSERSRPVCTLSTGELRLGRLGKRKKLTGTVAISNTGTGVLRLTSLQVFNSALQVQLPRRDIAAGETIAMKVTLLAKYLKLTKTRTRVLIICNDAQHMKQTVDVTFE